VKLAEVNSCYQTIGSLSVWLYQVGFQGTR
jgi:hypothetical protein